MAINLALKYSDQIEAVFAHDSFIRPLINRDVDFTGVRSIRVSTLQTVPMNNYNRGATSNRYGTPTEIQDYVNEMVMSRERSFANTIDRGNNSDQQLMKKAGSWLKAQLQEQAMPDLDMYALQQYTTYAGKVAGISAPDKTSIIGLIMDATLAMDNALVPREGRTLLLPGTYYKPLKLAQEFVNVRDMAAPALTKGLVGQVDNMNVVMIPDTLWPANVYFMVLYRNSAILPVKLNDTYIKENPPGLDGWLIEGRLYYDAFIMGAKANGVYVAVASGSKQANPSNAYATSQVTITSTATTTKYTLDGSDPRYSMNALTYSAPFNPTTVSAGTVYAITSGQVFTVKSVGFKSGGFTSDVISNSFTAS